MSEFPSFAMMGAMAFGLVLGPILWWVVMEVLRQLAWRLEFGRLWLPHPHQQDLCCVSCGTDLLPDDTACAGCGKSREIAFLGSLREVEIASEQLLRLNRQGTIDPLSSSRVEEALNRQRSILNALRRPQKAPERPRVELILPDEPGSRAGYIDPETFYESYHPGAHPLRLQAVTEREEEQVLPQGSLYRTARMGGIVLLAVSFATFFHGAFPPGSATMRFPGMAESWTGLAFLLAAFYTLAFGRRSAPLARLASFGTACLIPLFWICVPWIHGTQIAPIDWALALVCASLCQCAAALIDRHLFCNPFELDSDGLDSGSEVQGIDRLLLWCAGCFLAMLQLGALAGLARPDSWFGPWTWIAGQWWGLLALAAHRASVLALLGPNRGFSLPQWLFEGAFGLLLCLACAIAAASPAWGATILGIGTAILTVFVSLLLCHLIGGVPRLLKPTYQQAAPWVMRTLMLLIAVALAQRKAPDPHPWIAAAAVMLGGLAVLGLGGHAGSRFAVLLGLLGVSLAAGLVSRQIMAELHHEILEQFWLALGGFALGAAVSPWIARIFERIAHPKRMAPQSAMDWSRMVSVQILLAGGLAALLLALAKKAPSEVHFWANPATVLAWLAAVISVAQVRGLRAHGFGLLACSGAILVWGVVDKTTNRGPLAIQSGLAFLGACGFLLALGERRSRLLRRRLSQVSTAWAGLLCSVHLFGVWALWWSSLNRVGSPLPGSLFLVPGLAGCLTWMLLARHRNLPGLAWMGAFWLIAAFLSLGRASLDELGALVPALLSALTIALLGWSAIAGERQIAKRSPLGVFLTGAILIAACALAIFEPGIHVLLLLGSSLLVLIQSRRLVSADVLIGVIATVFGAFTLTLARYLAGIWDLEPGLAACLGLAVWVVGTTMVGRLKANWPTWTSTSRALSWGLQTLVCAAAMVGTILALGLAAVTDDWATRTVLAVVPFLMSLCTLSDSTLGKRHSLQALALGLGFWGWLGIALAAIGPELSERLSWFLAMEGCLAALAFLGMGLVRQAEEELPLLAAMRKALRIFAPGLSLVSIASLLLLRLSPASTELTAQGGLILGVVTALILAASFLIEGWRIGSRAAGSLNLVEFRRLPYWQELQTHGSVLSAVLGLALLGLCFHQGALGASEEFAVQVCMALGALFAGLLRGPHLRWLARPIAWQCLLILSGPVLWNLALLIAMRLEARPLSDWDPLSEPQALLLRASLILAMVAIFLNQCRPAGPSAHGVQSAHPGEDRSGWGSGAVEGFAWLGSSLALPALLMQQKLISTSIWVEGAAFLVVPAFGLIASWARQPGQQASSLAEDSFLLAEPYGNEGKGSTRLSA